MRTHSSIYKLASFHCYLKHTQIITVATIPLLLEVELESNCDFFSIPGQTLLILQNAPNLNKSVHSILTNIYQDAHNISEKSLSFIRQDDEEYFSKLHPLVAKPLLIAESYRRIDPKLKWSSRPPGNQKRKLHNVVSMF